jgi:Type II secretory pathway, prepilin signal peptidase PulO and related peptidases
MLKSEEKKMQKIILLALLGWCSLEDVKQKKLTVMYILMFGVGGIFLHLMAPVCSIYSILWGMLLGLALILVSLVTRGSVGVGDGILLAVTGVYLGGSKNLELFMMGLLLAALWSLGLVVVKKKKGKEEIAFVPFLLISYFLMILRGV